MFYANFPPKYMTTLITSRVVPTTDEEGEDEEGTEEVGGVAFSVYGRFG